MKNREKIVQLIVSAFEGVVLGDGISLKQSRIVDNRASGYTKKEFAALPASEVTDDWQAIPVEILDDADCIPQIDDKGMRYYLPALMLRFLDNYHDYKTMNLSTLYFLYPRKEFWESQMITYEIFTGEQRCAIATYLEALPRLIKMNTGDETIVNRALDRYWKKYLDVKDKDPKSGN